MATKLIDHEILSSMMAGDDTLLAELATMFAQYMPDIRSRMLVAVADRDANALHENAHQLKSRLGYFGATSLQASATELETLGRDEQLDGVAQRLEGLLFGCSALIAELNELTGLSLSAGDDE